MHILLIFLDGIGIGPDNPETNPFSTAHMPALTALTNGQRWVQGIGKQESKRALFIPTDPRMGISGRPQSGTGHATIITGKNIPELIGEHYGPKPNAPTRQIVSEGSFFSEVHAHGMTSALITAYPPHYIGEIERGKRLPSALEQAAIEAGAGLYNADDLRAGRALSADWTGEGWHRHLNIPDVPLLSLDEGGARMVQLSRQYHFALFSHTFTDFIGHRGTIENGVRTLEHFDTIMASALQLWDDEEGLIIITSDHGNMEQIGDRHHTENDVPTLIIGDQKHRFAQNFRTLADIVPSMRRVLFS